MISIESSYISCTHYTSMYIIEVRFEVKTIRYLIYDWVKNKLNLIIKNLDDPWINKIS